MMTGELALHRGFALPRLLLLLAIGSPLTAEAHDFWVQPDRYWMTVDVAVPITLQVGHGAFRQRSPIPLRRIVGFTATGTQGVSLDLRENLHLGDPREDGNLQFHTPGTYVLVLQTDDRAQSHLPATRFNDYLKVEGLTGGLAERERTQRMDRDGSESYSRIAKSIVQVGAAAGSQTQVTEPMGLSLEIVPEINPYAQPRPADFPVRVIYEGQPLAGALVKLTNLADDDMPVATRRTDTAGRAIFPMPQEGTWLLNVIWTKPLPNSYETDFATVFSSLSFGFR